MDHPFNIYIEQLLQANLPLWVSYRRAPRETFSSRCRVYRPKAQDRPHTMSIHLSKIKNIAKIHDS